jgi:hypothetical protein
MGPGLSLSLEESAKRRAMCVQARSPILTLPTTKTRVNAGPLTVSSRVRTPRSMYCITGPQDKPLFVGSHPARSGRSGL